jgi:hypothetical protein
LRVGLLDLRWGIAISIDTGRLSLGKPRAPNRGACGVSL